MTGTTPQASRTSVVIPAYNAERTLAACARSVLESTRPPHEVIIVDDGSSDGTARIIGALAAAHGDAIRTVHLAANGGPAGARNAGARAATGDSVFFVDADVELLPDALERFGTRIAEADAVCGVYAPEPLNRGVVARYKALLDHYHFARAGVVAYDGFSGYCAGVRAAAFAKTGGFDERLGPGDDYENEEFGYRFSAQFHTVIDPSIQARHHFPGLQQLTRTYFTRVAQWMRLFRTRQRFESAGDATASTGMATVALPLALAAALAPVPGSGVLAVALTLLWLRGYAGFFAWVARRAPLQLPACLVLNAWFCTVIAAGAAAGLVSVAAERRSVLWSTNG